MHLNKKDCALYYKLRDELFSFVISNFFAVEARKLQRANVDFRTFMFHFANKIFDNNGALTIDAFVGENPGKLSQEQLNIVTSWKHSINGNFILFEHHKDYTVFRNLDDEQNFYAVKGITDSIKDVCIGASIQLPTITRTILHPFKGVIIYHGLLYFMGTPPKKSKRITRQKNLQSEATQRTLIATLP